MKAEKFVISIVAMVIGVVVMGIIFYLYQSQKTISSSQIKTITVKQPTPTPKQTMFLSISSPENESVSDSKTITVSGKTDPQATVVITTDSDQEAVSPSDNGTFSADVTIASGENILEVTAIDPSGEEKKVLQTITYSTEQF